MRRTVSLEDKSAIEPSGVWKRVFKDPDARNRHYPKKLRCRKCRKLIPDYVWFYVRLRGGKYPRRTYYCESCYKSLWI